MTARDRMIILVVALVVVTGAAWFTAIKPRRQQASVLEGQIATAQQRLDTAQVALQAARQAQKTYAGDYATIARLGKAVPADDDVPSLLVQLQNAARRSGTDFRSMTLDASAAAASAAAAPAPAPAPATPAPASGSGASGSSSGTSTTSTASTTPTTSTTPSTTPAPPAGSSAPAAPAAADATQTAAASLPPGAAVGAAGFPTMPFNFAFNGSFFKLEDFLRAVDRFTTVDGQKVTVRGRLLTIDGISLTAGPGGFPHMTAKIKATAYLLPSDEGLTLGASPSSPAPSASTPASATSSSTPSPAPAAVITGAAR
jgi:hypothetical protein